MYHGSKPPSPVLAAAHDASTVAIPKAARDSHLPRSDGASARPMARYRALSRTPAAIAAPTLPPAVRMASEPSCAAPENTTIDITIGATVPIMGRASTPNEIAVAHTARPNAIPFRIPALRRSRSDTVRSGGPVTVTG